jgi:asparagine synthetase B (glutamine-hydrolysing)
MALYFASRGMGHIKSHSSSDVEFYSSPARVLLNGLGSDELLGGYGRHRTAFNAGGWQAVIEEVRFPRRCSMSSVLTSRLR